MSTRDNINGDGMVYSPTVNIGNTEGIKDLFNKSHSYSYAVLCFQTAYLKAKYTVPFFKSLFNLNKDKAGMINKYILDARAFNVTVIKPHINKSECDFSIHDGKILFGLSAISKIGETVAKSIIEERNKNGKFTSLEDFIARTQLTKLQIISLIKAGAIPTKNKKTCLINYLKTQYEPLKFKPVMKAPSYKKLLLDYDLDVEKYRIGTKRFDYDKEAILDAYNAIRKKQFDEQQEIRYQKFIDENNKYLVNEDFWEFEALQIFIQDNPFEQAYKYMSQEFVDVPDGEECTIVGIIAKIQKKKDRNQKQFAYVNIYSSFGLTEAILWHSTLKEYEDLIVKGNQIAMLCKKDTEDKVIARKIKPYSQWLEDIQKINKKRRPE